MNFYKLFLFLCFTIAFSACEMDLVNPNAATDSQVLNTKDGLYALAIGIQNVYSESALEPVILTPSVTTRETAIMTTFANLEELELGGTDLSGENGYVTRLFNRLMRVKGMSEDLINNVDQVEFSESARANIKAWGQLYRAMCLGYLASNFEQVALVNGDNAAYVTRQAAFQEAISLLENNVNLMTTQGASSEFNSRTNNTIDILNTSRLFLARYLLYSGNYSEAISVANAIDRTSKSVFHFDSQNPNPIWSGMFDGTISYAPRQNFGLPTSEFTIDNGDQRVPFFLDGDAGLSLNNLPVIKNNTCIFFSTNMAEFPVYVPGEADLILAEAYARSQDYTQAEIALNRVRNKLASDDVFGIGAQLINTFSSGNNEQVLLKEIYKNRRIELFLTGNSLEDARRFDRDDIAVGYESERNRNFYPYPQEERLNNSNTPANPSI